MCCKQHSTYVDLAANPSSLVHLACCMFVMLPHTHIMRAHLFNELCCIIDSEQYSALCNKLAMATFMVQAHLAAAMQGSLQCCMMLHVAAYSTAVITVANGCNKVN